MNAQGDASWLPVNELVLSFSQIQLHEPPTAEDFEAMVAQWEKLPPRPDLFNFFISCVESGTHAELIAKSGLYSRLVAAASRDVL